MKKRFGKLLLAIVMTLQLVPSSMTTIAANDSVAYKDDFVQVTMEINQLQHMRPDPAKSRMGFQN